MSNIVDSDTWNISFDNHNRSAHMHRIIQDDGRVSFFYDYYPESNDGHFSLYVYQHEAGSKLFYVEQSWTGYCYAPHICKAVIDVDYSLAFFQMEYDE